MALYWEGGEATLAVWFSYTFHTYNFLISILHTQFTPQDWLGLAMTTDGGRDRDGENRKILRVRIISFYFISWLEGCEG